MEEGSGRQRKGGFRQWDHFLFFLCICVCVQEGVSEGFWTISARVSLSQPNILSVGFTTEQVTRLCAALIGSEMQNRERERGRKGRESEAVLFSFYAYTLKPKVRDWGKKRMRLLHLLFTYRHHIHPWSQPPLFFRSIFKQELLISHCGLNRTLLTLGVVVFSCLGGCFDRSWPRRSVATRSRSPHSTPSVRCWQWRPNTPPCFWPSARWRAFQMAWMSWVMRSCLVVWQPLPPSSFQHIPLLSWWVAKPFLGTCTITQRLTHVLVCMAVYLSDPCLCVFECLAFAPAPFLSRSEVLKVEYRDSQESFWGVYSSCHNNVIRLTQN